MPIHRHKEHFTREELLLHEVWKKATMEGEVVITLPSKADAARLRFSLYAAVRRIRAGNVDLPEILNAVESCSISISGCVVTVRNRELTGFTQAIVAAVGQEAAEAAVAESRPQPLLKPQEEAPLTAELGETEIAASLTRLRQLINAPEETPEPELIRETSYYTRKG